MWNEMDLQNFGFTAMMERFSSKVRLSKFEAPQGTYNFLSFLATAQALDVKILPISWNSAREEIGRGGTSMINQALANLQMSFAFKRVTDDERLERSEGEIYRSLINEMAVLSHRGIREHSNIVPLLGICWDTSDDTIWPVLVFERSQFGDLFSFARTQVGRELDSNARLKLCIEIGKAVTDMHSQSGFLDESRIATQADRKALTRHYPWRSETPECPHIQRPRRDVHGQADRFRIFDSICG